MWTYIQTWFLQFDPSFRPVLVSVFGLIGPLLAASVALAALGFSRWKHGRDAEMALRKDVYANASDAISEAFFQLRQMPHSYSRLSETAAARQKFSGSFGKILTVASLETQRKAVAVQKVFNQAYRTLAVAKREIEKDFVRMEELKKTVDLFSDRQFHYRVLMEGAVEPGARKTYETNFDAWTEGRTLNERDLRSLKAKTERDGFLAFKSLGPFLDELIPLRIELLIAFRRELGVSTDETWFAQEMMKKFNDGRTVRTAEVARLSKKYFPAEATTTAELPGPSKPPEAPAAREESS